MTSFEPQFGIGIDIGTSTVKAYLVKNTRFSSDSKLENQQQSEKTSQNEIIAEIQEKNAQYLYGKDVISRVMYAHYNGITKLQEAITFQLNTIIKRLCQNQEKISSIVITGNTVMLSILQGFSLQDFEKHPFKSPSTFGYKIQNPSIISNQEIYLTPVISPFLGGDAVSALFHILKTQIYKTEISQAQNSQNLQNPQKKISQTTNETKDNFQQEKYPFLLLDIGTNGELFLVTQDKIIGTSCAAGPAFEGENLSRKITGSTAINYLSKMLQENLIDKTGYLQPNTLSPLTQEDIRQLQLAKAAIRAGIETLLQETKTQDTQIQKVYICGNFGNALDSNSLVTIGLIPKSFENKISYQGNAAGFGTINLLFSSNPQYLTQEITTKTQVLELGGNPIFNQHYITHLNF